MSKALTLVLLLLCYCGSAYSQAPVRAQSSLIFVQGLRLWQSPESLRLVFDLSAPIRYSAFNLKAPNRLVIDLEQGFSTLSLANLHLNHSWISKAYNDKAPNGNTVRFVFELKRPLSPRSFLLAPNQRYGHRLVFDLMDDASQSVEPSPIVVDKPPSPPPANRVNDVKAVAVGRPFVVAVDAGHGGDDPGALGANGSMEKNITLAIARKLANEINSTANMKAILTRNADYFIPLAERSAIARRNGADIFVSIHADSVANPIARGASVWVLSQNGATSEMGRWLENKENSSDELGGVGGVSLKRKDKLLSEVLLDLSMTHSLNASMDFGRHVLSNLGNTTVLHKRDLQRAGFKVLKSPDIPSILVETSFISNPAEARKLSDPLFQQQLAEAIQRGISHYADKNRVALARKLKSSPAPASTTAAKKAMPNSSIKTVTPVNAPAVVNKAPIKPGILADGRYLVQPGDTLHSIARQFNANPSKIIEINQLASETIRTGQKLKVQ